MWYSFWLCFDGIGEKRRRRRRRRRRCCQCNVKIWVFFTFCMVLFIPATYFLAIFALTIHFSHSPFSSIRLFAIRCTAWKTKQERERRENNKKHLLATHRNTVSVYRIVYIRKQSLVTILWKTAVEASTKKIIREFKKSLCRWQPLLFKSATTDWIGWFLNIFYSQDKRFNLKQPPLKLITFNQYSTKKKAALCVVIHDSFSVLSSALCLAM